MTEAQLKKFIPKAAFDYCPEVSRDNETGYEVTLNVHPDYFDDLDKLARLGIGLGLDIDIAAASGDHVYITWR